MSLTETGFDRVHGRIDRSEIDFAGVVQTHGVHGRIDRSEKDRTLPRKHLVVHGRIDRSENDARAQRRRKRVHGRIDRSENAAPPLRLTLSIIACDMTTRRAGLVPEPDKLFLGTPRQPPRLDFVVFMPLLYSFVFLAVLQTITD